MSGCLVSIDQSHSTFILTLQLRTPLVTAVLPMCPLCSLSPRLDSAPRNLIRFNDSQRNTSETVIPETRPAPLALCADTYHSCLRLNRFRPAPMNCSEITPFGSQTRCHRSSMKLVVVEDRRDSCAACIIVMKHVARVASGGSARLVSILEWPCGPLAAPAEG